MHLSGHVSGYKDQRQSSGNLKACILHLSGHVSVSVSGRFSLRNQSSPLTIPRLYQGPVTTQRGR